ncbi:TCHQD class glutathione S-transferase [Chlorella sorokiniana]|uniref:TCHQD class glutathione S-transferase n=1 Tax=Chlorella sorokiniana TaxID=3076 RepID=A0A2P6TIF9_CHLSO|nr:TCHQD class glutathione S-transferase [Chlorella sorokiniana]|eukprot:PRW34083.1 TCHQD class glutathione S-transferase [Chlorella sorokiniana]
MAQPLLYDFILAYYPARARLMLVEKGVPYTTRPLNLLNGESLRPAFLRVNPAGTLPVLAHGDKTLTQSLDIVQYVDESLGAGGPLGGDGADPKLVAQWRSQVDGFDGNLFMTAHMEGGAKALMEKLGVFREKFAAARKAENPDLTDVYDRKLAAMAADAQRNKDSAALEENERRLVGLLDAAETRLGAAGAPAWLAGSAYSQADVLFSVVLWRIAMAKQQSRYIEPRPAVLSYYQRIQQRPSWRQVFAPSLSGLTAARLVLPALIKAWWAGLTGRY